MPRHVRPVDRERLPRRVVPVVMTGVAAVAARCGFGGCSRCRGLGALWHDRRTGHARGRIRCGCGRRGDVLGSFLGSFFGCGRVLRVAVCDEAMVSIAAMAMPANCVFMSIIPIANFQFADLRRSVGQIHSENDRIPPAATGRRINRVALFRRGLGFHVHDLDAAVGRIHRRVRILRLVLAVADGDEVGAIDAILVDQVLLDRIGAALGEILILRLAADRVGVTGNHEGRRLQAGARQCLAEFLHRSRRPLLMSAEA